MEGKLAMVEHAYNSTLRRLKQEHSEFRASQGYM